MEYFRIYSIYKYKRGAKMEILKYFPDKIEKLIVEQISDKMDELEEIRIRNRKTYYFKNV